MTIYLNQFEEHETISRNFKNQDSGLYRFLERSRMNIRRVGKDWVYFEDYAFITATYRCYTPPDRRVQVGMGVFALGEPRGEKVEVKEQGDFTVLGAGAIHIRISDGGPDCEIAITRDSGTLIPVLRVNF